MAHHSHTGVSGATLNRLRASVLGANDGIVSTSSVVMGVVGAGANHKAIYTAGMAALIAGALSMAVGEYVSVSSQSDAEKVHIEREHGGDPAGHEITSPWQAAVASFFAFSAGGLVPFLAVVFSSQEMAITVILLAVSVGLLITGYVGATIGKASRPRAMLRVFVGGFLAMGLTYLVGVWFGTAVS